MTGSRPIRGVRGGNDGNESAQRFTLRRPTLAGRVGCVEGLRDSRTAAIVPSLANDARVRLGHGERSKRRQRTTSLHFGRPRRKDPRAGSRSAACVVLSAPLGPSAPRPTPGRLETAHPAEMTRARRRERQKRDREPPGTVKLRLDSTQCCHNGSASQGRTRASNSRRPSRCTKT